MVHPQYPADQYTKKYPTKHMGSHHGNKLVVGHSYQYKNAYSRNKGCIVNKMLSVIHDIILKMKVTKIRNYSTEQLSTIKIPEENRKSHCSIKVISPLFSRAI